MNKIMLILIALIIFALPTCALQECSQQGILEGEELTTGEDLNTFRSTNLLGSIVNNVQSQQIGSIEESSSEEQRVTIEQNAYHPSEIHVHPGTTVIWQNKDSVTHTITSGTSEEGNLARFCYPWDQLVDEKIILFDSGNLEPGQEYSITFEDPGEYHYSCRYHPDMVGKVIVSE